MGKYHNENNRCYKPLFIKLMPVTLDNNKYLWAGAVFIITHTHTELNRHFMKHLPETGTCTQVGIAYTVGLFLLFSKYLSVLNTRSVFLLQQAFRLETTAPHANNTKWSEAAWSECCN